MCVSSFCSKELFQLCFLQLLSDHDGEYVTLYLLQTVYERVMVMLVSKKKNILNNTKWDFNAKKNKMQYLTEKLT